MRTIVVPYEPKCCVATSSTYYSNALGTSTQRVTPVSLAIKEPSFLRKFEAADDLGTGTKDMKNWHSFQHYSRNIVPSDSRVTLASHYFLASSLFHDKFEFGTPLMGYVASKGFGPLDLPINGLPSLYAPAGSDIIPNPANLDAFVSASLRAMLPGIRPQLSLLNSLYELKDFKSLPRTVMRIKKAIDKLPTGKKANWKRFPLRRILGAAADSYLQSAFNILPLLRDIVAVRNALSATRSQIEKLVAGVGQVNIRHFTCPMGPTYSTKFEVKPQYGAGGTITGRSGNFCPIPFVGFLLNFHGQVKPEREVAYDTAVFHAEMKYSYTLTQAQRENSILRGHLDALGVNLNPQIIWNAIPWSFVVDWVLGIGQWLGQFSVKNLEPQTVIHNYLWSVHVSRTTTVYLIYNIGIPSELPEARVPLVSVSEDAYKRVVRVPDIWSSLTASGISFSEFTLASALALSRR